MPHQSSVVTLTRHGYIKRQPVDAFRSQRRGGKGVKGIERKNGTTSVEAPHRLIACDTHDHLLMFTSRGRVYGLQAHEVEARSREWRGLPVRNVVDLNNLMRRSPRSSRSSPSRTTTSSSAPGRAT